MKKQKPGNKKGTALPFLFSIHKATEKLRDTGFHIGQNPAAVLAHNDFLV